VKPFRQLAKAIPSPVGEGKGEGISRARRLRRNQTWAEKLMWHWLRDRRFSGYKFRRQHPLGNYVLDFFCEEAKLNVELDGSQHGFPDQRKHDEAREKFLRLHGIKTLRFWNSRMRRNAQSIRDTIFNELQIHAPHPLPDYTRPMNPPSPRPSPVRRERENRSPLASNPSGCRSVATIILLIFLSLNVFADDVITNFMSPIASYQYQENLSTESLTNGGVVSPFVSFQYQENLGIEVLTNGGIASPLVSYDYPENFSAAALTNGGILSPIVSYQYYEWPTNILGLQYSPTVSYYYQFLNAPVLNIVSTTQTPTTAESTPAYVISPPGPSQLLAYHGGIFTANLASIDPNQMTVVLTHGWKDNPNTWALSMAILIHNNVTPAPNIVAWDWSQVAQSSIVDPGIPAAQTGDQGRSLGEALQQVLGVDYSQPIHFIGHSLGTLVNASAANYLQGTSWANNENGSPTPWPAVNMQMTLFDEAEVATGQTGWLDAISTLIGLNGNPLEPKPFYYHPLPKQCAWADNYVSAFGLLHPEAANVILTDGFPTFAPDLTTLFNELEAFHNYPTNWYDETIQNTGASAMGFQWSFEEGGLFSQAPATNSVFEQASSGSQWDLVPRTWNYGTNFLNSRFQDYQTEFAVALADLPGDTLDASGYVLGQAIQGLENIDWQFVFQTSPGNSGSSQVKVHPLGEPANNESNTNIPAYAWMQLIVPTNAISMSFDYIIQGDWQSDSLAAAFNGTNVLFVPGDEIQTNATFSSGAIDVSAYAGQTNEFFVGIVGGTSTNAQLTVENLAFTVSLPPLLQAQASGGNLILSWPVTVQDFSLQTTTNLADPNSWETLTNVPAIVNLQNSITNPISGNQGFYRLIQSQ
jgi:very-short-patch-repair endonuclease/pimeloyl-ACP methyl ester carboxylesterase